MDTDTLPHLHSSEDNNNNNNTAETFSEAVLFAEKDEANRCIAVFGSASFDDAACRQALQDLRRIFDKYMECPSLLDQSMEPMVTSISGMAISILQTFYDNQLVQQQHQQQQLQEQEQQQQQQPTSPNDNDDDDDDSKLLQTPLPYLLSALYALSKVRGKKFVQRFLSHEVDHILPILVALEHFGAKLYRPYHGNNNNNNNSNNNDIMKAALADDNDESATPTWEIVYSLWNWMGMLSLVPFGLHVLVDSESTVVSRIVTLGYQHLSHSGAHRETAAACLASWLSRPDLQSALEAFIDWAKHVLDDESSTATTTTTTTNPASKNANNRAILVMGVIRTVVTILKIARCGRDQLQLILEQILDPMTKITEMNRTNIGLRKLVVKWWTRMACANLAPRVARWRYQRGRRSLVENLMTTSSSTTKNTIEQVVPKAVSDSSTIDENLKSEALTTAMSSNQQVELSNTESESSKAVVDNDEDDDDNFFFVIPDQIEVAMGYLIDAITDSSTVVRWSAAKGVGRLTERLPSVCVLDVLDAVLDLCHDPDKDHAWHGACLTLAELARRGLLLPSYLTYVVPLVVKAIQYDVQRGNTSVGSAVRDAACYTYWAFARAYSPDVLRPYIRELSQSVVVTCLFDREVNCRRAASAAFQECVGRQGANNFKNGIEILTLADYFSLGNRVDAYTCIALQVARFDEYRRPIIEHVYKVKLRHWDVNIRVLSSNALRCLTPLDVPFVSTVVIPSLLTASLDQNLPVRHGAVLGLAEILLALGKEAHDQQSSLISFLKEETCCSVAELVPSIEKRRLYRGRGGEIMRSAVCRFIQCLSLAKLPLMVQQQVRLLDSVDACIPHPNENIQKSASDALGALMTSYFPVSANGPSDRLQKRVVDKFVHAVMTEDNPAATKGYALALGSLPSKLLAPSTAVLDSVLNALCAASRPDATVGQHREAETRRNALTSLTRICQTVGVSPYSNEGACVVSINYDQLVRIYDSLFRAMEDYNTDRRGDVGSWSRVAAMHGLEQITYLLVSSANPSLLPLFDNAFFVRLIGSLLKQLAEKLDSVRSEAGTVLTRILTRINPPISLLPQTDCLLEALMLSREGNPDQFTRIWSKAAVTFPMVMNAARIDEFFDYVIAGTIISVGGLTEAVTKHSSAAFLQFAKEMKEAGRVERLGFALLKLSEQHRRRSRVIFPLLKTLDLLISHRYLDNLIVEKAEFGLSLCNSLKLEETKCNDVHQLFAIARVSLGLLAASQNCELDHALCLLACKMLSHRFPRVRSYTAQAFYILLLERPDLADGGSHDFGKLLLEAPWDGDLKTRQIKEMTMRVAASLGIIIPDNNMLKDERSAITKAMPDEFASYAALHDS